MSQRERNNHDGENKNRQSGKTLAMVTLVFLAFILGSVIASVVTVILLKQDNIISKLLTVSPTLSPTPTPLSIQPYPTPTESPNISLQPTSSPTSESVATNVPPGSREVEAKNIELPGYFPERGFKAPPSDLSRFKKANLLLKDMVISGDRYIDFVKVKILVRGQLYTPIFRLSGESNERRIGMELDGLQKALLLQFGLQDLSSGDSNLTYLVRISADGKLLWAGECVYGKNQQIISVPMDVPGAKSLVIEYSVSESGGFSYNMPPLYFTKAELLYE